MALTHLFSADVALTRWQDSFLISESQLRPIGSGHFPVAYLSVGDNEQYPWRETVLSWGYGGQPSAWSFSLSNYFIIVYFPTFKSFFLKIARLVAIIYMWLNSAWCSPQNQGQISNRKNFVTLWLTCSLKKDMGGFAFPTTSFQSPDH